MIFPISPFEALRATLSDEIGRDDKSPLLELNNPI